MSIGDLVYVKDNPCLWVVLERPHKDGDLLIHNTKTGFSMWCDCKLASLA